MFSIWVFGDATEDMMYGWAIPPVAAYMIWKRRATLRELAGAPNFLLGIPVCLLSVLLFWLGNRGGQVRLAQLGLIVMVVGLPLLFWGGSLAKQLLFPAGYLILAIPLSFLDTITFPLRLASSSVSAALLNGFGIAVTQVGTALLGMGENGFKLDVADPCSGIRSLIALLAITAGYAGLHNLRFWVKALLIGAALPLAFVGNIVRLMSTAIVSQIWGERAGVLYHDQAGFLVFPMVVLLSLVLFDWAVKRSKDLENDEVEDEVWATEEMKRETPLRLAGLAGVIVCLAAVWACSLRLPPPEYESDAFVAQTLPAEVAGFQLVPLLYCQNEQCMATVESVTDKCPYCGGELKTVSFSELSVLPKDTRIIKGMYRSASGHTFNISVIVSGKSRMSIHRPEVCLPGQGFNISKSEVEAVPLKSRTLYVNCVDAARTGEQPMGLIYWFVNPRGEALSHWRRIFSDVWSRTVHNQMNRWCMITVNSRRAFDEAELITLGDFLTEWYPQVVQLPEDIQAETPPEK